MSAQESKPATKSCEIINGPNRYDLVLQGLVYNTASNKINHRFFIKSEREGKPFIGVSIDTVQRKDGSGHNFNFEGCNFYNERVKGSYNTKTRKGFLTVEMTATFRNRGNNPDKD